MAEQSPLRSFRLGRQHAKYLISAGGTLGLYVGGFLGAWLGTRGESGTLWAFTCLAIFGVVGSLLGCMAADRPLGKLSDHVDLSKVVVFLIAAACAVWALSWLLDRLVGIWLHPFFSNLLIFGAGAAAAWVDE